MSCTLTRIRSPPLNAAFEDIAHVQIAADRLHVERPTFVGEAVLRATTTRLNARQVSCQALGYPVNEMLMARVAADIGERQDDDRKTRRPVPTASAWTARRGPSRASLDCVDPDRPRDVLERLLAQIGEIRVDFARVCSYAAAEISTSPGPAYPFQPRGDVDPVAQNVVALYQDVAEIDAYAIHDALGLGCLGGALDHQLLDGDSAFDGSDNRRKFQQQAVAGCLDDRPPNPATIGRAASRCSRTPRAVPASSSPIRRE